MKRKKYLTREEKILDFVIGFVGLFVLNGAIHLLLYAIVGFVQEGAGEIIQVISIAASILPWVINVGLLVFCAWWRSWIAIGALSALGFLVMLSILAGICCAVACLTMISIAWLASALGGY